MRVWRHIKDRQESGDACNADKSLAHKIRLNAPVKNYERSYLFVALGLCVLERVSRSVKTVCWCVALLDSCLTLAKGKKSSSVKEKMH